MRKRRERRLKEEGVREGEADGSHSAFSQQWLCIVEQNPVFTVKGRIFESGSEALTDFTKVTCSVSCGEYC